MYLDIIDISVNNWVLSNIRNLQKCIGFSQETFFFFFFNNYFSTAHYRTQEIRVFQALLPALCVHFLSNHASAKGKGITGCRNQNCMPPFTVLFYQDLFHAIECSLLPLFHDFCMSDHGMD